MQNGNNNVKEMFFRERICARSSRAHIDKKQRYSCWMIIPSLLLRANKQYHDGNYSTTTTLLQSLAIRFFIQKTPFATDSRLSAL